jgi:hypothetical protein
VGGGAQGIDAQENPSHWVAHEAGVSRTAGDAMNQWRGEDIRDKSILVWTDQGLGDTLMLARYIPKIKARRVVVYCDAAVFRLLRYSLPGVEVLMKGWAFPKTDLHVPWMSLMQCFGLKNESEIPQGRHLNPPHKQFDLPLDKLRVGVNWQGNKRFVRDFTRSMPFSDFKPLLDEDFAFVSLQKGNAQQDLPPRVIDVMDGCEDLCDTASLIDHLDLVITTDTAVPHVAGGLGKPTWLMEAFESEWRWGLGDISPWYHSVRVFRQPKPGDWTSVIENVRKELRRMNYENAATEWSVPA